MARAYTQEDYEKDCKDGFVRMLTSYNPQHNPTYIDEGNNELFVVEQQDADGNVDQLHLTPNMAFEMREKLNRFLAKHFPQDKPKLSIVKEHAASISRAASALPLLLLAACKLV